MNIFIMVFAVLIMGAYFMMHSPAQRVTEQETEYAITQSDLRAVAECAVAVHNASIHGAMFDDECVEQLGIQSAHVCLNGNLSETGCEIVRGRKPEYSFLITTTVPLNDDNYDHMMDILEKNYSDSGTFGIFNSGQIVAGGTATHRDVPKVIVDKLGMTDGQLVYMTQYEIPDEDTEFTAPYVADIDCPAGTVKTYRFSRWQCVPYNTKSACAGDTIWNIDSQTCVPDESRKPLCASEQTAVMVDDVWECINPFPDLQCPTGMIVRLNYTTLEWECVTDPSATSKTKKCDNVTTSTVFGAIGTTAHVVTTSCTDCEKMLVDEDTCQSVCVPDETKLNDARCYPSGRSTCSGPTRAFYFGFPSLSYAANVEVLRGRTVPIGAPYSRNRRFGCMECIDSEIDTEKSFPPYIAICKPTE